jgi:hypothetical protein
MKLLEFSISEFLVQYILNLAILWKKEFNFERSFEKL